MEAWFFKEAVRGADTIGKAMVHVGNMLRRRGYGPLEAKRPASDADALGVHSYYIAKRATSRMKAMVESFEDSKIGRRIESHLGTTLDKFPFDREDCMCVVACHLDTKPGVGELGGYLDAIAELGGRRGIVLVQDKMTNPARKIQKENPIEVFRYAELLYDPTAHDFWAKSVALDGFAAVAEIHLQLERFHRDDAVPKNVIEAVRLLRREQSRNPEKTNLLLERKKELPRYFSSEKVSRYYGLVENDVVLVRQRNFADEAKLQLRVVCKPVQTTVSK